MIELPPLLEGVSQETSAELAPGTASIPIGADGVVSGVTAEEEVELGLVPMSLRATTLKV